MGQNSLSLSVVSRLPTPGSDDNIWGDLLNDFLAIEHNTDGTLKKAGAISQAQTDASSALSSAAAKYTRPAGGIPESDLDSGVQTKLNTVASGGVSSVNGQTGVVSLTKNDVGLGNVDNTADANKPVSSAAQTALNSKVNTSALGANGGVATLDGGGKVVQDSDAARVSSGTLNIARIPDLSSLYLPIGDALQIESYNSDGSPMKLIALADGSVRAVPQSATSPAAPTGLAVDIHLSFVRLTWQTVVGATQYRVSRDGTYVQTVTATRFTDTNIQLSDTYEYTVIAVNQYGMWSPASAPINAFIDPALNSAPVIDSITLWPTNPKPNDLIYVHVNATDIDAHELALALGTTVGSLTSTLDPSTWKWSS
jgi:hypothetical protein